MNADPRPRCRRRRSWRGSRARRAGRASAAAGSSTRRCSASSRRAGYATSRAGLAARLARRRAGGGSAAAARAGRARPGFAALCGRAATAASRAPPGVRLDSGGLGKGLAADLAAATLPARRPLRDLLRRRPRASAAAAWGVAVRSARTRRRGPPARVRPAASRPRASTTRLWRRPDGTFAHHLLDPSTGEPAWTGLVAATAAGRDRARGRGAGQERAALRPRGARRRVLARHGGVLQHDDGRVEIVEPRPVVRLRARPGARDSRHEPRRDPLDYGWWLASRSAGIVAYLLLSACGAARAGDGAAARLAAARASRCASSTSDVALLALAAIAAHGLLLLGDPWLKPGLTRHPGAVHDGYRPVWTGLGILAGYLAAGLSLTYYRAAGSATGAGGRAPVHPDRLGARGHARVGAGTDAVSLWLEIPIALTVALVIALLGERLLGGRPAPARAPLAALAAGSEARPCRRPRARPFGARAVVRSRSGRAR